MSAAAIIFYILAAVAVASAAMVVLSRSPIHSAIYLVLTFLCVACVYLLLEAEFVAMVQVLVYAGGIMVLFLFVIMLVNLRDFSGPRIRAQATVSSVIGVALVGLILFVYSRGHLQEAGAGASVLRAGGNLQKVGWILYRDYLLPFEVASILLLVAMIGAIVLARQRT
ncbi:MAG: NADH-quinone oxidoreductase subunit J [Acidobacteriota bacterium]